MFSTKGIYFTEAERLESFIIWPFDDNEKCNKKKMAEAGFYWSGNDIDVDTAQCFVCHKVLDGWESSDDPWQEHKKHAPQCAFVKLEKSEDSLSVSDQLNLLEIVLKNKFSKSFNEQKKYILSKHDKARDKMVKEF